jgi:hypothetical protein
MRAVPVRCEYIDGIPRPEGKGIKMIYCLRPPQFGFSIFGISPLYVCEVHLQTELYKLGYYMDDIEVQRIS